MALCKQNCNGIAMLTSQKRVSLSSGKSPLASSRRKSRLINFLKPQSLPWTNLYALWLSVKHEKTKLSLVKRPN